MIQRCGLADIWSCLAPVSHPSACYRNNNLYLDWHAVICAWCLSSLTLCRRSLHTEWSPSPSPHTSSTHNMTEPASSCRVQYLRATRCFLTMWSMRGLSYCLCLWTVANDYQQILSDEQSCASSLCLLEGCLVREGKWKNFTQYCHFGPKQGLICGLCFNFSFEMPFHYFAISVLYFTFFPWF